MSKTLTSFRSVLDAIEPADGRATVSFPADWAQGRGTFGGLAAAAALRVMRSSVGPRRLARSLSCCFVGPLSPGVADVVVRVMRDGRVWTHLEARIEKEGRLCAAVGVSFGAEQGASFEVPAPARPSAPRPDELVEFPFVPGVTPTCTQHFEYRWAVGQVPFSHSRQSEIGGWIRFRTDQRLGDEEAVLALVDAWPAPVLPMLTEPAPASTVHWSLGFADQDLTAAADDWWYFHANTVAAGKGHALSNAMLWAPSGAGVATSQQLVAVFDAHARA